MKRKPFSHDERYLVSIARSVAAITSLHSSPQALRVALKNVARLHSELHAADAAQRAFLMRRYGLSLAELGALERRANERLRR